LKFEDAGFYLQVRPGAVVTDLNQAATELLNSRGQGGVFAVDAGTSDPVDFDRCYNIQAYLQHNVQVYIKQTKMIVQKTESWFILWEWITKLFDTPHWSVFRLFAMVNAIQRPGGEDQAYTFNWEEGKQYWWDNVYDPAMDRGTGQGKEMGG
jgi:hypothetical protein